MSTFIVPLPGVLARVEELYAPLMLERFGYIHWPFIDERRFYPEPMIAQIAMRIEVERDSGDRVVLLGSSLGGMQASFVVKKLREERPNDNFEWLQVVIVDSPNGTKTCKMLTWVPGKGLLVWPVMLILRAFALFIMWIGRMGPGLPKDDEISQPAPQVMAQLSGRSMTFDAWKSWVKAQAKKGLKGHKANVWAKQVRWMAKVGADGSLRSAAEALQGIDVTYLMCTDGNATVVQPDAALWWQHYAGADIIEVASPHCGYLQKQAEFDDVMAELLGN